MGIRRCAIDGCKSVSGRAQHRGVTFHSIPNNPLARQIWMAHSHLPAAKVSAKSTSICSRHFRRADFQPLKNNKYLLKPGAVPTIFPWGQLPYAEPTSVANPSAGSGVVASTTSDASALNVTGETSASYEESIVKKILLEAIKANGKSPVKRSASADVEQAGGSGEPKTKLLRKSLDSALVKASSSKIAIMQPAFSGITETNSIFVPGAHIDALDFSGLWHPANVLEVDQDECEVLIHFETSKVFKQLIDEWIPMNSSRLRQSTTKIPPIAEPNIMAAEAILISPQKALPIFEEGERCMARWTGSRKWKATVQKVLDNDQYEVLFDDGYTKISPAKDISKIRRPVSTLTAMTTAANATEAAKSPRIFTTTSPTPTQPSQSFTSPVISAKSASASRSRSTPKSNPKAKSLGATKSGTNAITIKPDIIPNMAAVTPKTASKSKRDSKGGAASNRKGNPPIPIPKFDLVALNLPPVPTDGEWCCNWVNDTPIGEESYLEGPDGSRRPTVRVDDWRLPSGWIKHLYQRSSVSGKWDVVLVGPTKKRFRSKNDVKVYLEEHGETYNPDVYDFSIHKRRAKDLELFIYTSEYKEMLALKQQQTESTKTFTSAKDESHSSAPIETPQSTSLSSSLNQTTMSNISNDDFIGFPPSEQSYLDTSTNLNTSRPQPEEGYVYVGTLKVQLIDNQFRCPEPTCNKNFRRENILLIHVKHYHQNLVNQMGDIPKMSDLAYLRTMGQPPDDAIPKNQIPNSQFFEKVYQSDLSAKAQRKTMTSPTTPLYGHPTKSALIAGEMIKSEPSSPNQSLGGALISPEPTASKIDDPVLKKITKLEEALTNKEESSFEQTYFVQDCIGGYTKPSSTSTPTHMANLTDAEALITSHAVSRSPLALGGGSKPRPAVVKSRGGRQKPSSKGLKRKIKIKMKPIGRNKPGPKPGHKFNKRVMRRSGVDTVKALKQFPSDYEDNARHSFGVDLPPPPKSNRLKFLQQHPSLESTLDNSNHTVSSFGHTELSGGSPRYINENGEMIKIVRMRQEEIINCLCSYGEEDGLMIQCELCLCWQHGICNGIEKESQVPDKYVCYICRNPVRGRESMKYIHDQDWLYEGRLPVTPFNKVNPKHAERFDMLKQSHTLTGNLLELKKFMHSLRVKINIAENKDHPKMYLWSKTWEKSPQSSEMSGIEPLNVAGSLHTAASVAAEEQRQLKIENDLSQLLKQEQNKIDEIKAEITSPLCATPSTSTKMNEPGTPSVQQQPVVPTSDPGSVLMYGETTPTALKEEPSTPTGGDTSNKIPSPGSGDIDGSILANLLASPGGTNIDLVGAVAAACKVEEAEQEQKEKEQEKQNQHEQQRHQPQPVMPTNQTIHRNSSVNIPQPEAAIDPVECQRRLLEHIQKQQALVMTRLQTIEADIIGLEAMDEQAESLEPTDSFGRTKQCISMLLNDLTKMGNLASYNSIESTRHAV